MRLLVSCEITYAIQLRTQVEDDRSSPGSPGDFEANVWNENAWRSPTRDSEIRKMELANDLDAAVGLVTCSALDGAADFEAAGFTSLMQREARPPEAMALPSQRNLDSLSARIGDATGENPIFNRASAGERPIMRNPTCLDAITTSLNLGCDAEPPKAPTRPRSSSKTGPEPGLMAPGKVIELLVGGVDPMDATRTPVRPIMSPNPLAVMRGTKIAKPGNNPPTYPYVNGSQAPSPAAAPNTPSVASSPAPASNMPSLSVVSTPSKESVGSQYASGDEDDSNDEDGSGTLICHERLSPEPCNGMGSTGAPVETEGHPRRSRAITPTPRRPPEEKSSPQAMRPPPMRFLAQRSRSHTPVPKSSPKKLSCNQAGCPSPLDVPSSSPRAPTEASSDVMRSSTPGNSPVKYVTRPLRALLARHTRYSQLAIPGAARYMRCSPVTYATRPLHVLLSTCHYRRDVRADVTVRALVRANAGALRCDVVG